MVDDINAINLKEVKNIICVKGFASGTHEFKIETPYGLSERVKVKGIIPPTIPVTINLLEKVDSQNDAASASAIIKETEQVVASSSTDVASNTASDAVIENAATSEKLASDTQTLSGNK